MLATQGPSDLEAVDRALLPQVLQDTAWQLAFRQGCPRTPSACRRCSAGLGQRRVVVERRPRDDAQVERPRVSIDEWMNAPRARRRLAAGRADRPRLAPGARPRGAAR